MVIIESKHYWNLKLRIRTELLARGLRALIEIETPVAALAPKAVMDTVDPGALRTYMLALIRELGELLEEFDWKPWKRPISVNKDQMMEEFADVLAFLGIITRYVMIEAGCTTNDLAQRFRQKSIVNVRRLKGRVEGYGVNRERGKRR